MYCKYFESKLHGLMFFLVGIICSGDALATDFRASNWMTKQLFGLHVIPRHVCGLETGSEWNFKLLPLFGYKKVWRIDEVVGTMN
jgi:hypothetical protein